MPWPREHKDGRHKRGMDMMMRKILTGLALGVVLATALALPAQAAGPEKTWDGLERVKSDKVDEAYLLPGADFRVYDKVMIDPTKVSFRKRWVRDMNSSLASAQPAVSPADVERIRKDMADWFTEALLRHLKKAGYQVVDKAGPDVLRLTPVLMDVYINAPDTFDRIGRVEVYTLEAGEATLAIEARDADTGQLLGRAVDHRWTGRQATWTWSTRVSNRFEFSRVFDSWSSIIVDGLASLKESSPVAPVGTPH